MARVALSLGGNIEPRRNYLKLAVERLKQAPFSLLALSSVYETEPVDVEDQPLFLNLAVLVSTDLQPLALLRALQSVEHDAKKEVLVRRGPRTLDIDLLLYDAAAVECPGLIIPHERMTRRAFVLAPLAEIAPGWRHPIDGRAISELLAALPAGGPSVRRLGALEAL